MRSARLDDEDAPRRLERRVRGGGDDGLAMSPTSISAAPLGVTQVRSGWAPSSTRARGAPGRRALGQQLGGELPGDRALARARRPVEEVGVARRVGAAGARAREDGAGVRVAAR